MRTRRKNMTCEGLKNRKMNDKTYTLRRKVINIIYTINDLLKAKGLDRMPRVDVRIVDDISRGALGTARMGDNIVWIPATTTERTEEFLYNVVAHELCHAVYIIDHIDTCPLMQPGLGTPMPIDEVNKHFLKYAT